MGPWELWAQREGETGTHRVGVFVTKRDMVKTMMIARKPKSAVHRLEQRVYLCMLPRK